MNIDIIGLERQEGDNFHYGVNYLFKYPVLDWNTLEYRSKMVCKCCFILTLNEYFTQKSTWANRWTGAHTVFFKKEHTAIMMVVHTFQVDKSISSEV